MIQDHHNGIIHTDEVTWVDRVCAMWNIQRTPRRRERAECGSFSTDIYSKKKTFAQTPRSRWPY